MKGGKNYFRIYKFTSSLILLLIPLIGSPTRIGANEIETNSTFLPSSSSKKDGISFSGWTEVSNRWPLDSDEYFVTHTRKHSYVEMELPEDFDHNLIATFEYYYDYDLARPSVQAVACKKNVEIIGENNTPLQRVWRKHELIIYKEDCYGRNKLRYNVLLHDDDDVFAWRLLHVKRYILRKPDQNNNENPATQAPFDPISMITTVKPDVLQGDEGKKPENPQEDQDHKNPKPEENRNLVENPEPEQNRNPIENPVTEQHPRSDEINKNPQIDSKETEKKPHDSENADPQGEHERDENKSEVDKSLDHVLHNNDDEVVQQANAPDKSNGRAHTLRKRDLPMEPEAIEFTCKPSNCDRSRFLISRFLILPRGAPELPAGTKLDDDTRYYVNFGNVPLKLEANSSSAIQSVNTCVNLELFMEPGSEMEFVIRGKSSQVLEELSYPRQDPSSSSQSGGRWESFERCIDDYTAYLNISHVDIDDSLVFEFVPKHNNSQKRVALLTSGRNTVYMRKLHPVHAYIPNLNQMDDSTEMLNYWRVGKRRLFGPKSSMRPYLKLENTHDDQLGGKQKLLSYYNIDPDLSPAVLMSRWIKISGLEPLENEVLFVYEAKKEDWIKSIDMEIQTADWNRAWKWQNIYESSYDNSNSTLDENSRANNISLPIRLKGLTTGEFRVKLEHHVKEKYRKPAEASPLSPVLLRPLRLEINSLALGDLCATGSYCQNGGTCEPTGCSKAVCHCLKGYSGAHCQEVNFCEVINQPSGMTGKQLCESVGAKCVQGLPVHRCVLPDDRFYQCKALFENKIDESTGNIVATSLDASPNPDQEPVAVPVTEQLENLKEYARNQTQMVIILSVFLGAMLLFSIVIIVNLINRIIKSKRQLKESRSEAFELARRAQPSTSAGASGGRDRIVRGVHRPSSMSATLTYNNQAFDAD